jgi:D-aminopeptidase
MSPLFLAIIEATEEAILNSLFMAESVIDNTGERTVHALPIDKVIKILEDHRVITK